MDFLKDGMKSFVIHLVLAILAGEIVYCLLARFNQSWWILTAVCYFTFSIIVGRLAPILILPLFYKIKPIADERMIQKIKTMTESVGAKLVGVFEMDMSRKTKKANAMFTGLGKSKRIIFGDTLLEKFSQDEVEVVLAHEMGHYYHRDMIRFLTLGFFASVFSFYIASRVLSVLLSWAGIGKIDEIAGLPSLLIVFSLIGLALMPLQNSYSRRRERLADIFALNMTKKKDAFISAMTKLSEINLSDVNPPRWIEFLLYNHPSIRRRILLAQLWKES